MKKIILMTLALIAMISLASCLNDKATDSFREENKNKISEENIQHRKSVEKELNSFIEQVDARIINFKNIKNTVSSKNIRTYDVVDTAKITKTQYKQLKSQQLTTHQRKKLEKKYKQFLHEYNKLYPSKKTIK